MMASLERVEVARAATHWSRSSCTEESERRLMASSSMKTLVVKAALAW